MIADQQVTTPNTKLDLKFIAKCICLNLAIVIIGVFLGIMTNVVEFEYFPTIVVGKCQSSPCKCDQMYICDQFVADWIIKECCTRLSIDYVDGYKTKMLRQIGDVYLSLDDLSRFKDKLGFYYYLMAISVGFCTSFVQSILFLIVINITLAIAGGIICFKKSVREFFKFYESGLFASVVIVIIGCVVSLLLTQIKLQIYLTYSHPNGYSHSYSQKSCFSEIWNSNHIIAYTIAIICGITSIITIVVMAIIKRIFKHTNSNESIEDSNQLKNSTSKLDILMSRKQISSKA